MVGEYVTSILLIIGIDILLGGDNAVVIALASRKLPEQKRNIAIILGTTLAIFIRILLTAAVVTLLKIPFLQLAGGCVLLWISLKLLIRKEEAATSIPSGTSLWKAVQTMVIADVAMGLDNVIAIAGAAHGHISLVVFGFLFSVPIIILGSKLILYAMERYSFLIYIGGALLAYTAGKMIIEEQQIYRLYNNVATWKSTFPFMMASFITLLGFMINRRKAHRWT
ncbi:integral membrane protein, YjbE family [Parageobacillus thermantarcticus]|jgi:YjbE family integral membrane protein|uniref:Integral membrane protein, YjbE family n=1 Tax=Parageobacillus thermantarcticus TaxID=186116 RepID=A0A1I0SUH3_9BACL|nr:TerC family protein [Parageobacillus thermantarcticus]SFA43057.1 integral membrane protein, YjbE family [Parageobacillus thermantarcticus]